MFGMDTLWYFHGFAMEKWWFDHQEMGFSWDLEDIYPPAN